MSPFVRYTLLRFTLFGAVLAVLVAVGVRGVVLVLGALLVSAALSYLLLSGPRQVLVERLEQRTRARQAAAAERARSRPARPTAADRDAAAEDAADERSRRS